MKRKPNNKKRGFSFILIFLLIFYIFEIYIIAFYPHQINIVRGENKKINSFFPFTIDISEGNDVIENCYSCNSHNLALKKHYTLKTSNVGNAKLQFKLFGLIPVKEINVNVVDRICVIPGGNSIGVKLNTKGVLVVALSDVVGIDGKKYSPAREAGIKVGDAIVEIDGEKVKNAEYVINKLNSTNGDKINVVIERNNINFSTDIKPVKCIQDNCYRIGVWVRDKTAGIGTLTFYDEKSKKFGALGHGITDFDTGKLLNVQDGKIMKAKISDVEQGKKGTPGEIKGIFFETENIIGNIEKNTKYGIYGSIYDNYIKEYKKQDVNSMPVGFQNEIKEGSAYILTTNKENKIEKYEIKIIKKQYQTSSEQKSMIFKVTDKKLIQETGGIVQGMSGSPIIQDGKIIGAVTHVFVNDPTKGYGLYIEWMLQQAGIEFKIENKFAHIE